MIIIHPSFKKIILFCIYLVIFSSIYAILDVDAEFIKSSNDAFYKDMASFEVTEKKIKKNDDIIVSLNSAGKDELMKLPFIGEKTAERIIDFRKNTPFERIEDIMKIKGIGKNRFNKLKKNLIL